MVLIFVLASQLNLDSQGKEELDDIVDDLYATEDGETGEETHCSANQTKS